MDPFVRRLVERMLDKGQPLSRNKHFHTFNNPEGKAALALYKRINALGREILATHREKGPQTSISTEEVSPGVWSIELKRESLRSARKTRITQAELELLLKIPGVRESL